MPAKKKSNTSGRGSGRTTKSSRARKSTTKTIEGVNGQGGIVRSRVKTTTNSRTGATSSREMPYRPNMTAQEAKLKREKAGAAARRKAQTTGRGSGRTTQASRRRARYGR